MVFLAALLAGTMAVLFVFGLHEIFKRDVKASRFSAFRYSAEDDLRRTVGKTNKQEEKEKAREKLLIIISAVVFASIMLLLTGKLYIAVIGAFGGVVVPKVLKEQSLKKNEKQLMTQIEQAAEVMSMVLRSGGGMSDALEKALQDVGEPLKKVLADASAELKMGASETKVFRRLADRVGVDEVEMLSVAAQLQHKGMAVNMANVLKQIQNSVRSRQAFHEEVRAITSENRMAVWVVSCVPVCTIGLIRLFSPDFIAPLFNTFIGVTTLVLCTIMVIVGIIWALRIADSDDFI